MALPFERYGKDLLRKKPCEAKSCSNKHERHNFTYKSQFDLIGKFKSLRIGE